MSKTIIFILVFLLGAISVAASPGVVVIQGTGGTNISADTTSGAWTTITGPTLRENTTGDIRTGFFYLVAPAGFVFDTSAPNVTVLLAGHTTNSRNINDGVSGTSLNITSINTTTISFDVDEASSSSGVPNNLTFQNIRIRPTSGVARSANVTFLRTSSVWSGLVTGDTVIPLTVVAGSSASLNVTPKATTINQSQTKTFYATEFDAYGNSLGNVTGATTFNISAGAGGSFASNVYTPEKGGVWTITGRKGSVINTTTLTVTDITKPVIAVLGTSPLTIEALSSYVDAGATASDETDGVLTSSIVTTGSVTLSVVGTYVLTYNVTDAAGNKADGKNRTVTVVDTTAPVITIIGSNPVDVSFGTSYVDAGATASDTYDGTITGAMVTNTSAVNTAVLGMYTVTYDVTDANGNTDHETRAVHVVDTAIPIISMSGSSPVTIEVGSNYSDAGATATDDVDGSLTSSIVTVNGVASATLGNYTVTYDVMDSSGNNATTVTRSVRVVDTTIPNITLTGSSSVTVEVGSVYSDAGATAADNYGGDVTGSIVTVNPVNMTVLGNYTITYNVVDAQGNAAVEVTRTVHVVDTTVPVITMTGGDVSLTTGDVYSDAGATASDNYDGDITGSIVTTGSVDTGVAGTYTMHYDVTDAHDNVAVTVTRTITVSDPAPAPAPSSGGGGGGSSSRSSSPVTTPVVEVPEVVVPLIVEDVPEEVTDAPTTDFANDSSVADSFGSLIPIAGAATTETANGLENKGGSATEWILALLVVGLAGAGIHSAHRAKTPKKHHKLVVKLHKRGTITLKLHRPQHKK